MFFCINIIIEAQTLKAIKRSPVPSYVSLGDTLILILLCERGRLGGEQFLDLRAYITTWTSNVGVKKH